MKRFLLISGALLALIVVFIVVRLSHDDVQVVFIPVADDDTTDTDPAFDIPPGGEKEVEHFEQGRWRIARDRSNELDEEGSERLDELEALPYLQGYKPAPVARGVTVYDPERACPGVNLCNSGDRPEAYLMDMSGRVLHRWYFEHTRAFPKVRPRIATSYFRRVHLLKGGDLLAIFDDVGIVRINAGSGLVWAKRGRFHHDLAVTPQGRLYLIKHQREAMVRQGILRPALPDNIVVLDLDGNVQDACSLLECFKRSDYADMLDLIDEVDLSINDVLHTNSIRVLDGSLVDRSPAFKKGNVLVSLLRLDAIAVVDMDDKKVVWASSGDDHGMWSRQHDPTLLADGHMLLFDNRGHEGRSKVIEFDPFSNEVYWRFADGPETPFFSMTCGAARRLPNDNTLITESDAGRAFEVTIDGDIVWEYLNPRRAGDNDELIATLFEVQRVDTTDVAWVGNPASEAGDVFSQPKEVERR